MLTPPLGKSLTLSKPDSTAIQLEVTVRSVNLCLLFKASLFPAVVGSSDTLGNTVLFTLLLYGGFQLSAGATLVWWHRRRARVSPKLAQANSVR